MGCGCGKKAKPVPEHLIQTNRRPAAQPAAPKPAAPVRRDVAPART